MPTEHLTIPTSRGYELAGSLEIPTGLVRGAALFAHCFTCTKQSKAAVAITRALARHGIACLRFDFTGLGGSGGDFGRAGFASDVEDLVESAQFLSDRYSKPILLIGHSLGGAAVLAAAKELGREQVAAIATIGAPADVPHVLGNIEGDLAQIQREGQGHVTIGGRRFNLSAQFLEQTRGIDLLGQVGRLRIPLLFCHSPTDEVVDVDNAAKLFGAAKHPKSFISLAGADHLMTEENDATFVADVIASWGDRYIPMEDDWPQPEEGVIVCSGHGKFGTEIHTTSHKFIADEPRSYGGDDTGPTPYDFLLASLGACTSMTMGMYARHKKWPLDGVQIHLVHSSSHAQDCENCVEESGMPRQVLTRKITVHGEALTDEQRLKILKIADRCPVHKTLEGEIEIETVLDR